jgi:hypothetical protein
MFRIDEYAGQKGLRSSDLVSWCAFFFRILVHCRLCGLSADPVRSRTLARQDYVMGADAAGSQCRPRLARRPLLDCELRTLGTSFASLFPEVDCPLLGEVINLLKLRVREFKFLQRIQ